MPPLHRPRRSRRTPALRDLVRETTLSAHDLVYPVFLHADQEDVAIEAMPGQTRWSPDGLLRVAERTLEAGVRALVLFPKIEDGAKDSTGTEVSNEEGLVPRSLRALKARFPELALITDVALDPYSSDGHDGIVDPDSGVILNDETVEVLCRQAVVQARAGADVIAPSDMMDGRVGAIREALDAEGFTDVSILAYTAKYASSFYGPFRGALDSAPKDGDKKTYQMDPANAREAMRELYLDEAEGADMVMVKPAGPYLDIVRAVREATTLPVAAYQVSGEYLMIEAAARSGWLDRREVALESLTGIKRAGADMILTYHALDAAGWLAD
ncbi:MAG: porphobilinogen synthase [Planctomycetota bacterium]|nr:porphobilinogen synthase [Planctomycetota bacterium]MDG1983090.1 porphobilinogen synthase [Planctomycetota bacterium]